MCVGSPRLLQSGGAAGEPSYACQFIDVAAPNEGAVSKYGGMIAVEARLTPANVLRICLVRSLLALRRPLRCTPADIWIDQRVFRTKDAARKSSARVEHRAYLTILRLGLGKTNEI